MYTHILKLQNFINNYFSEQKAIIILEAGCGSISHLTFNKKVQITGIDISQKQLERNRHLHTKIHGDLQTYIFNKEIFDCVVCWDVLEHLKHPIAALDNMSNSLKKNGLLIIKAPNPLSLKGLITKITPLTFHRFLYKTVFKRKTNVEEEIGPYKTYLKFVISPNSLMKYAVSHKLKIIFYYKYDITQYFKIFNQNIYGMIIKKMYKFFKVIIEFFTFGLISDSEFILVLQKK